MTSGEKQKIAEAFRRNDGATAGRYIQKAINEELQTEAVNEVTGALADDTLSVAELLEMYGWNLR